MYTFQNYTAKHHLSVAIIPLKIAFLKGTRIGILVRYGKLSGTSACKRSHSMSRTSPANLDESCHARKFFPDNLFNFEMLFWMFIKAVIRYLLNESSQYMNSPWIVKTVSFIVQLRQGLIDAFSLFSKASVSDSL
jgi:hypothetical protein